MSIRRLFLFLLVAVAFLIATRILTKPNPGPQNGLIVGRNVNMVAGDTLPDGDPFLQRQNEPSIAVSTRNPLHLLAGANDYRSVGFAQSEGELPGQQQVAAANEGDAWLGVFKSFNGGQSWISTLLPGCKYYDTTPIELRPNPLYDYGAAADPTVKAAANGIFYYSGIAFDRVEHGRSVIFVARYIDNNNIGYIPITNTQDSNNIGIRDPIKYIDTTIIDDGTSGQFTDKPWLAVDIPRDNSNQVLIGGSDRPDIPEQWIPAHNVYIVYSVFTGSLDQNVRNKIFFARSTDCGDNWERPIKLSESFNINQGTTLAVSPKDGTIYVAWRGFASENESDAIIITKSVDCGLTFSKPKEIPKIKPFDQGTTEVSFRTSAFPALAVDHNGIVYVAWSQRREELGGFARIVIIASKDGRKWTDPTPTDDYQDPGHQIMPSLTYAARKLMMTWYDTRNSLGGHYQDYIVDPAPTGERHTMDVMIAQALPSNSNPLTNPSFSTPIQVSRYLYQALTNSDGKLVDANGNPIIDPNDPGFEPPVIEQAQFNPPNYPLFIGGTVPFHGDYIDISPAPMFLPGGSWRFNTEELDPAIFHITWTDNRDVRPPHPNDEWIYWQDYNTPGTSECPPEIDTTARRNQNIYTSQISQGILIGSPGNTKPLTQYERTFLVFVKNLTDSEKHFQLTIIAPEDMELGDASFWQEEAPAGEQHRVMKVSVGPYSSITLTIFVKIYSDPYASLRVKVEELDADGNIDPFGFQGFIILNPDPINTAFIDKEFEEIHNPTITSAELFYDVLSDATMLSQDVVYTPNWDDLNFMNPDVVAPNIRSPNIRSDNIINPNIRSPNIRSIPEGEITDLQWKVTNNGDTASAYSFTPIGENPPPGIESQLLIYRVNNTPTSANCILTEDGHHDLLLKIDNPNIRSGEEAVTNIRSPNIRSNTFFLAPGETAIITLRLVNTTTAPFDPLDYSLTAAGAATPQAINTGETEPRFSSVLFIYTEPPPLPNGALPKGEVGKPYDAISLYAEGGTPPYQNWEVVSGKLPPGLEDLSDGKIDGIPIPDSTVKYPYTYFFTLEVKDSSGPQQIARRNLSITIESCFYIINATASEGGTIDPSGNVMVPCGADQAFIIKPDQGYSVFDVIVDGVSQGPLLTYTFINVVANHVISAIFEKDEEWIKRYNNSSMNDKDEANAIAADSSGIYVTGYSIGSTTGPDYYTIGYDSAGNEGLSARYDGPAHEGDYATAIAVDKQGNVYVTGYSYRGIPHKHSDYCTVKYNNSGELVWDVRYDARRNGNDEATAIALDELNNFVYITGKSEQSLGKTEGLHYDYYTIKYDVNKGRKLGGARYNASANNADEATAIAVDSQGNVYVTGYSFNGSDNDYVTVKYLPNGDIDETWGTMGVVRYDGGKDDKAVAIAVDKNSGNVYVTGYSFNGSDNDYVTIWYDESGFEMQVKEYNGGCGSDEPTAIAFDSAGYVYVTGKSKGDGTEFDYVTIKYDTSINELEVARHNNKFVNANDFVNGNDEATAIALDPDGNIYVTGRSEASGTNYDYFTIKYDSSLNVRWVAGYDSPGNGKDEATAITVDDLGNVYVTGRSDGFGTLFDYITLMYKQFF